MTGDVRAEAERAQEEARRVAEHAQALINDAHRQMAETRKLAAEATAAAEEAAAEARAHAQAISENAEERADRVVDDARRAGTALTGETAHAVRAEQAQRVPERLTEHTKAELVELALALEVQGTSNMTKDQLVRAVRRASRTRRRS